MKKRDINLRVLFIATVPALTIALLLGSYFTFSRFANLERSLADRGIAIARQLAPAAEFGVVSGNRAVLEPLVAAVAHERDVAAVTIRDAENNMLAHNGEFEIPLVHDMTARLPMQSDEGTRQMLISSAPVLQSRTELEEFFSVIGADVTRVPPPPKVLGRVYVAMSRATLIAERKRAFFEILAITLLVLVANMFLAVRMSRNLSRPLVTLTQAVRKLADGALDTHVVPDSDGALRELEDGVNTMAAALKSAHADLEQRVANATMQLEQKKEEAERANLAKSRFLAVASHDLRQPVHALGLFIASLHNKPLSEEVKRLVSQIERSVFAMQDLLESLLDISRLDAGVVTPNVEDFLVQRVLTTLHTGFLPAAGKKGVTLRMVPCSVVVRSDPMLLERILLNFVSNAVRYTARGKIVLGCRRLGDGLRIEVWDTGVGVPEDQQRHIFEEFYRVPGSRTHSEKGLGLGLAIVDRLARLLGHELILRSTPGKGSMFAVKVPFGTVRPAVQQAPMPVRKAAELEGARVMVVDDDRAALRATEALLETWGCIVHTAASGSEAELLASEYKEPPQLVICDYRLSQSETGIDVLKRLREVFGGELAAIVVSADTSPETVRSVKRSGYTLLHKPLRPAKLRALALHLLGRPRNSTIHEDPSS